VDVSLIIKNKENCIKWLNEIRSGSGDARPLWKAVTPKVIEFVDYEFHPSRDTHKMWAGLGAKYLKWKIKRYKVSGIGYLTGALKNAASKDAIKTSNPKNFIWALNTEHQEGRVPVSKYAYRFHFGFKGTDSAKREINQKERPIYKYTAIRVNNFLKLDAKEFNNGSKHANFIYTWLKKELEKGEKSV
jgi:hypothetical protein